MVLSVATTWLCPSFRLPLAHGALELLLRLNEALRRQLCCLMARELHYINLGSVVIRAVVKARLRDSKAYAASRTMSPAHDTRIILRIG